MNILLIEDSATITKLTERTLTSYHYIVHTVKSNHNLIPVITSAPFKIIIMNTNLQQKDSLHLCTKIRKIKPKIYLIGINHKGSWKDKTEFLIAGGDDCLSFPFPTQELIARIQSMMRRPKTKATPSLKYGNIKIVPHQKKAYYYDNELDLTKKEFGLLNYFVRNKERPISRAELLDHVWDYKKITNSNTVDVHIQKLRQKMLKHKINKYTAQTQKKNHLSEKKKTASNQTDQEQTDKQQTSISHSDKNTQYPETTEIKTIHGIGYKLSNHSTHKDYTDPANLPVLK